MQEAAPRSASRAIFTAVWMAILLGLGLQVLIFLAKTGAGAHVKGAQVLVDVAGGVTWSLIVCAGVTVGTVASRNASTLMGLLGLVCAPLAFAAAKGVQRGAQWMLAQPPDRINALVVQTGIAKTIEYALLGFALGRLIRTPYSTLRNHAALGLAFGLTFGALVLALNLTQSPQPLPSPKIIGIALNEFVFPMGCSMVIYWIARLSDPQSALERAIAGGG